METAVSTGIDRQYDDLNTCTQYLRSWQLLSDWEPRTSVIGSTKAPEILDFVDSVFALCEDEFVSLARIGDGELGLATGVCVPNNGCQIADVALGDALKRVLACDNPKCLVALPKSFFYHEPSVVSAETEHFATSVFPDQARSGDYIRYLVSGYRYLDASMSVVTAHYTVSRKVHYAFYGVFRRLLRGRDVILVTGDMRYADYDRQLLADAGVSSLTLIRVPQQNAWGHYARVKGLLLDLNSSGERLVCLACGPTASVLAYELADRMQCLDIGHMLADYNRALGGTELGAFWA